MGDVATAMSQAEMLKNFALMHIGSGKDMDDVLDNQNYGHIVGLNQRHKWGLDPSVGSPLQICAAAGAVEPCMLLVDAGASINFCMPDHGNKGATPLLLAIKAGKLPLVKLLLERG